MAGLEFLVPGLPIAQPRARSATVAGRAMVYDSTKHPVNAFKAMVALSARIAHDGPLIAEPVWLGLKFVFPRTQAQSEGSKPKPRIPHTKKPDVDNLTKSVCDALNGILWVDDAQVCILAVEKWIAAGDEQPHVAVSVVRL